MSTVQIRGLLKVHKENRRAANEQQRELAHLRHRAYRGCETAASVWRWQMSPRYVLLSRSYLHQVNN